MNRFRRRPPARPGKPLLPFVALSARPLLFAAFIAVAAVLLPAAAQAQVLPGIPAPSDTVYEVQLLDASVVIARITEVDQDRVVLTTLGGGRLEIDRNQIRSLQPAVGRVVRGEFWHEDPGATRLFFTATGRTLAAGESYVGTYVIVLPFAAVGVTDRFTITAGAPVLLGELEPFYVGPKLLVYRSPSVHASVGTLAFFFDNEMVGVAYGVGTFGNTDKALSTGIGYFYSGDEVLNKPAFMLGGETRVGRRMKLITENYVLPDAVGVIWSGGVRIIGDAFNTEVAVAGVTDGDEAFCCMPLINFSYSFGR